MSDNPPSLQTKRTDKPWQLWLVTIFGSGMLPGMPGTYGSAVTSLMLLGTFHIFHPAMLSIQYILIAGILIFSFICVWLGDWAQGYYGKKDPGSMVVDEGAGICLTMLCLPRYDWICVLITFVAFRIFDITKPPPIRQLEKLPAGWGILADDLLAAVFANLLCQLVFRQIM